MNARNFILRISKFSCKKFHGIKPKYSFFLALLKIQVSVKPVLKVLQGHDDMIAIFFPNVNENNFSENRFLWNKN